MSSSSGATLPVDDPALASALSEMSAEGYDLDAPVGDLPETVASQPTPSAPVAAAPPVGDTPEPASPTPDPLDGTEPFTYGANKTALHGVYRVPGEGLLVPEASVPAFESFIAQREQYEQAARQLTEQQSTFDRLTTWTRTTPDGTEQTYSGQQGVAELRLDYARLEVERNVMEAVLRDPAALFSLLAQDAQGNIIHNPERLELLAERASRLRMEAERTTAQQMAALLQPVAPAAVSSTPDYSAQAPSVITEALQVAGLANAPLTPEDRALLTAQLPQHVRTVTVQDRARNPLLKVGAPIVSESFTAAVKHLASIRVDQSKTLASTETSAKFNAAQDRGRAVPKKSSTAPAPVAAPVAPQSKSHKWDAPFQAFMAESGIAP